MLDSQALESLPRRSPEQIERYSIASRGWRRSKLWVCATCKCSAYYHPDTDRIWGCKKCRTKTASIIVCFVSRRSLAKRNEMPFLDLPFWEQCWGRKKK
ncbi:MAG: hypothetical protein RL681_474 [Candidatus Parcubacteria bacterium]|jgi:hypothetical protein